MRKILIIQTASIGDVILATPVPEKLHVFFPEAEIDFLVKKGMEELFRDHPFLHEILIWDKKKRKNRNLFSLLKKIRKTKYDLVINLQRFGSTGILTGLSGAERRIGFKKNPFSFLFTEKFEHKIGDGTHEIERNLSLIASITDDSVQKPALYPTPAVHAKMMGLKKGTYYTISPASLWFTKQYPAEKWVELLSYVDEKSTVYCLGAPNDRELCDRIIRESGHENIKNLAGGLTFLESASLMKDAKMNFTNDSAPMHLAAAVNAPVTAIFCSTITDFGFGPLSDDRSVAEISTPLYCRPCGLHGFRKCPEGHFRCAFEIEVEKLVKRL